MGRSRGPSEKETVMDLRHLRYAALAGLPLIAGLALALVVNFAA